MCWWGQVWLDMGYTETRKEAKLEGELGTRFLGGVISDI